MRQCANASGWAGLPRITVHSLLSFESWTEGSRRRCMHVMHRTATRVWREQGLRSPPSPFVHDDNKTQAWSFRTRLPRYCSYCTNIRDPALHWESAMGWLSGASTSGLPSGDRWHRFEAACRWVQSFWRWWRRLALVRTGLAGVDLLCWTSQMHRSRTCCALNACVEICQGRRCRRHVEVICSIAWRPA
jgi:hypothetical protein